MLILYSSLFALGMADCYENRIMGGEMVRIEQFPYQVALEAFSTQFCGGSILAARKVLTAAHCIEKFFVSTLKVRAGSSFRGKGGQLIAVDQIHVHPLYDNATQDYDVTVLTLAEDIEFGLSALPIRLAPAGAHIPDGYGGVVTGWGLLENEGRSPLQLQAVIVYGVDRDRCQEAYLPKKREITDRMSCFGTPGGGRDACQGDSGGPLVAAGGIQFGVVSWGIGCGLERYPGVYAKVSELRDFIDAYVNDEY